MSRRTGLAALLAVTLAAPAVAGDNPNGPIEYPREWGADLCLGENGTKVVETSSNATSPEALIDGYANGWRIPALAVGTSATVHFTWTPQHLINIAQLVSLLGLLACVVIAAWPPRHRRRHRELAWVAPTLDTPLTYEGSERSWRSLLAPSLLLGVLFGIVTSPFGGLGALVLAAVGLRFRRSRALFFLGAAGSLALAGLYTAALQHRHAFPWNIQWTQHFGWANTLGWATLVFLVVDTAIESLRINLRRSKDSLAADEDDDEDH